MAMSGIFEIDLHGKNEYQAKVTIDAALRRAKAGTYRLRLIHGYHGGTALRDMIRHMFSGRKEKFLPMNLAALDLYSKE